MIEGRFRVVVVTSSGHQQGSLLMGDLWAPVGLVDGRLRV